MISSTAERDGTDVFTTIDHTIQANAEQVLRADGRAAGTRARATAIVLDPRTGASARDGAGAGLRREQRQPGARSRCSGTARSPTPTSRARRSSSSRSRRALANGIVTPGTTFTLPYSIPVADRDRPRRRAARHRDDVRRADPLALLERRCGHDRREARRAGALRVDHALRLRQADRARLPRREPRPGAAAREVVRFDDRQRADRTGDRSDADSDGRCVRCDRERGRVGAAAPRRPHRRARGPQVQAPPDRLARGRTPS